MKVRRSGDEGGLFKLASSQLKASLNKTILEKGSATFGLCSGRAILSLLSVIASERDIDWSKVHFFMLDERLVSIDSNESNFKQIGEIFFDVLIKNGKISPSQIHPFIFREGEELCAIESYNRLFFDIGNFFDILIMSSGEDGHIASIFPNHPSVFSQCKGYFLVENSPKPPSRRISVSKNLILSGKVGFLFFMGEGKRDAYLKFNDNVVAIEDCPAKLALGMDELHVFTDLIQE